MYISGHQLLTICKQGSPAVEASKVEGMWEDARATGGANLRLPVGASANGMFPKNSWSPYVAPTSVV